MVIASRPNIRGIEIGKAAGIPTHLVRPKDFPTVEAYSDAMARLLDEARVDLVCLAGFLSYWIIPDRYLGRVMNIHPALLPAFGGKGMYGHHVHEAVLRRGCKVSGCTVHFVNNAYDEGPIILQRAVPVYAEDTPDDLAARVFEQECIAYPEAIRLFAEGRLKVEGAGRDRRSEVSAGRSHVGCCVHARGYRCRWCVQARALHINRLHLVQLLERKHRAVPADVLAADVAPAALAHAALHPVLQRGVDVGRRKAQLREDRQRELDHDRRAADQGHAPSALTGPVSSRTVGTKPTLPFQSGVSPPGSTVVTRRTSLAAGPLGQFVLVDQVGHGAGAVEDRDVAELAAAVQDVPDDAPQRRQGDAAGDEDDVLALPRRRSGSSCRTARGR